MEKLKNIIFYIVKLILAFIGGAFVAGIYYVLAVFLWEFLRRNQFR